MPNLQTSAAMLEAATLSPATTTIIPLVGEEEFTDEFAYDLHKKTLTLGEAINDEAINLSVENILSTLLGERIFSPFFGSPLPLVIFEQLTQDSAEKLLYELIASIERWEDRITLIQEQIEVDVITAENTMTLVIPYIINRNGLTARFARKIIL